MRKLSLLTFLSLDGVMQAPGGPDEDTSGGFTLGGWTVPFFDEALGAEMTRQMTPPFDLLLGRKTFEIFAAYWPQNTDEGASINAATKYVASRTRTEDPWERTVFLRGELAASVRSLKEGDGPDLQVHGSADLIQTLLQHDLVDELHLKTFPVVLGAGARLFGAGAIPAAFKLVRSTVTPSGVIMASYTRDGAVKGGSF